ncbi:EF-hand domain-containing protein [Streptomyces sp. NPDC045431]|uniref:EF-hand domain-containing protein n=1 Tax=Streptomyces sp. NPDC045431 TaxID=3155613 RepID=UPI0033F5E5F9
MTDTSSKAHLSALREFRSMDADGDGSVGRDDFLRAPRRLLEELGIPEDAGKGRALMDANERQWGFLLSIADKDEDGTLTVDEYTAARISPSFRAPQHQGEGDVSGTLFDVLDADGDGSIDRDEFVRAADFLGMTAEEAGEYFARLDADDSGRVDGKEFLKAVKRFYTS